MKFIIIISFIDFYSVFSVFVTNTVILLEPCCGTITEPGLPVIRLENFTKIKPKLFTITGISLL